MALGKIKTFCAIILALLLWRGLSVPLSAQYREYYIYGKIVDSENQPLQDVAVFLRDQKTSRSYKLQTDKKGQYTLVGLPHGIYQVTISKEGYETKTDEWNFATPQDRMQKVEMQTIALVSTKQVEELQRARQAHADLKEATEKIRKEDFDGAVEILSKFVSEYPEDSNAHYLLGISFLKKGRVPEAVDELKKTTQLSPSFVGAYHQLGICFEQTGETERALEHYGRAIEIDSTNTASLYNRGLIFFRENRIEEALADFEKALEQMHDDAELWEMAGRCLIHHGEFKKAMEYFEKAKSYYENPEKVQFLDELIAKLKEQIKESLKDRP